MNSGEFLDKFSCFWTEKTVPKVWGREEWLTNENEYCAKLLQIMPGFMCSMHKHSQKTETFLVLSGCVLLEELDVRGNKFETYMPPGQKRRIEPGTYHRFSSRQGAWILEISTHHSESDSFRITESGPIP